MSDESSGRGEDLTGLDKDPDLDLDDDHSGSESDLGDDVGDPFDVDLEGLGDEDTGTGSAGASSIRVGRDSKPLNDYEGASRAIYGAFWPLFPLYRGLGVSCVFHVAVCVLTQLCR